VFIFSPPYFFVSAKQNHAPNHQELAEHGSHSDVRPPGLFTKPGEETIRLMVFRLSTTSRLSKICPRVNTDASIAFVLGGVNNLYLFFHFPEINNINLGIFHFI
jgi:hypothetical protein